MWKVTRKGLRANFIRFILTAIAVIVGVSFVSGTLVFTSTISSVFDNLFTNVYKKTDAAVRAPEVLSSDFGPGQRPNFPASVLVDVKQAPGVAAASGQVQNLYAQLVDKHGKAIGTNGNGPPTLGFGWNDVPQLNQWRIQPGGHPPETDDQIVIDKNSAETGSLHLGDVITVLTTKAPKKYTIVGIAKFGSANSLAGASATIFVMSEAQRLANSVGQFGVVSAAAKPGVSQPQLVQNIQGFLASKGESKLQVVTGKQITKETTDAVHESLSFINIILLIFAFIALIVGAVIIYNTFSIVVGQRTREMALLRALGASSRQVLTEVIAESFIVGLLASAAGVAAGIGLAVGLRALMAALGVDLPGAGVVIPASAVIAGLTLGTVITVLSSIVPARQASRVPPIAAMRDVALERPVNRVVRLSVGGGAMVLGIVVLFIGLFTGVDNAIWYVAAGAVLIFVGAFVLGPMFARPVSLVIGAPVARVKGLTGQLARENAARNPRRTANTATALIIGVALVGFITVFAASWKASIADAIDSSFKSDYIIQSGGFGPGVGLSPSLAREIGALPQIAAVTGVRSGDAGINGSRTQINAVDPAAASKLFDLGSKGGTFTDLNEPGTIAVSTKKANGNHWKLGDTIPVTFVKTGVRPLRVVHIYTENVWGDYFMSTAEYDKNYTESLDFLVFASLKPGVSAAQGRAAIEPLLKPYPTAKLQDNAQFKADQQKQADQIVVLVYALLFLALLTAMIGIANTLALSIHERTREVGLLRAVGMQRRQVRTTIRWESVIIALLGTINGLAIGLFFGWSLARALRDNGFTKFAVAPGQLLVVVLVLAVASVGAAWLPARRAAKLDVLKAVSTE
jgi:putative ABC transport system permease protein